MIVNARYRLKYELKYKRDSKAYFFDAHQSQYMRTGFNDDKSIYFIDPEGGPFMCVGGSICSNKGVEYDILSIDRAEGGYNLKLKKLISKK